MNNKVPALKKTIGQWAPFSFCVSLCGIVMVVYITTGKIETAYPAFFCFLPMAFFFMAVALGQISKELKQMSDRIDQLEGKNNSNSTTA
jgi:hypothetical protein